MGVFDFAKNAGAKVGIGKSTKEEAAEKAAEEAAEEAAKEAKRAAGAKRRAKAIAEHRRTQEAKERQGEAKKSMELEKYVRGLGIEVKRLDVRFDDGTAYVDGEVPNAAEKVRLVLALGNVEGVGEVDEDVTIAKVEDDGKDDTLHTVVSGDTLSAIAKEHYGDAGKYPVIFDANKPMLSDPDKIFPGQVLRIPDID